MKYFISNLITAVELSGQSDYGSALSELHKLTTNYPDQVYGLYIESEISYGELIMIGFNGYLYGHASKELQKGL